MDWVSWDSILKFYVVNDVKPLKFKKVNQIKMYYGSEAKFSEIILIHEQLNTKHWLNKILIPMTYTKPYRTILIFWNKYSLAFTSLHIYCSLCLSPFLSHLLVLSSGSFISTRKPFHLSPAQPCTDHSINQSYWSDTYDVHFACLPQITITILKLSVIWKLTQGCVVSKQKYDKKSGWL